MKRTPFKKGAVLSCFGFASLVSCGIYSVLSQSDQTLDDLPNIDLKDEAQKETVEESKATITAPAKLVSSQEITVENPLDKHDTDYLKKMTSYSLARRYKDYLVLVPRDSNVWKERAEKMADLAEKERNKQLYTYWNGYLGADYIRNNPGLIADGCRKAVSYSELTTAFTMPISKTYWNLFGNICGRGDKPRPYSGGWS